MNSNDCIAPVSLITTPEQPQTGYKCNNTEGGSMQIQRTICILHSTVSAFCVLAKGAGQAMRPISVPPTAWRPGHVPSLPPSHSTRTSGYCVVVAPRLGYNTGPINLRHRIDVLQWRLPTTVTAGQTIRLYHHRAVPAALPSTLRTPRRASTACSSTLSRSLGDSITLLFRAHR